MQPAENLLSKSGGEPFEHYEIKTREGFLKRGTTNVLKLLVVNGLWATGAVGVGGPEGEFERKVSP